MLDAGGLPGGAGIARDVDVPRVPRARSGDRRDSGSCRHRLRRGPRLGRQRGCQPRRLADASEILSRLGYLGLPGEGAGSPDASDGPRRFDPVKALRDLLPKEFARISRENCPAAAGAARAAQRVDTADIDWGRTRAFCLPTDLEGYIRVNLRGREPAGCVEPGAEYEAVLADLEAAPLELRDADTGAAVVREVWRIDRECPGDKRDFLPDLVVRWVGRAAARARDIGACRRRRGRVARQENRYASGPGIRARRGARHSAQ